MWAAALLAAVALAGCQLASAPPGAGPIPSPTARVANSSPVPQGASPTAARTTGAATATRTASAPAATPVSGSPVVQSGSVPTTGTRVAPSPTPRPSPPAPTLGRSVASPTPPRSTPDSSGLLPAGGERLTGEVTTFAASARVLQMRVDGGGERQVGLAPNAVVRRADGTSAPSEVRPGQRVQVSGRPGAEGTLIADEVVLLDRR